MTHTSVVDIHAHYLPESYIQLVIEHGARYADGTPGPLIHVEGDIPAGPITPEFIDIIGCERIMLGSDYCFKMGYERPLEVVNQLEALDDGQRAMILKGNAARLLRLEP